MWKRWVFAALLAGCGGSSDKSEARVTVRPMASPAQPSAEQAARQEAKCNAFADRVVVCNSDEDMRYPLTESQKETVREIAYAVCTKTTDDEAALHYYGDVEHLDACM